MDLMCSDYKRAAENREMVKLKQNIEGYLFIEALVGSWPRGQPLPVWLIGKLPTLHKRETVDKHIIYEFDE